jgi:hypothetical protein
VEGKGGKRSREEAVGLWVEVGGLENDLLTDLLFVPAQARLPRSVRARTALRVPRRSLIPESERGFDVLRCIAQGRRIHPVK